MTAISRSVRLPARSAAALWAVAALVACLPADRAEAQQRGFQGRGLAGPSYGARPPVTQPGRPIYPGRPGRPGIGVGTGIAIGVGTGILLDAIGRANAAPRREVVIETEDDPPVRRRPRRVVVEDEVIEERPAARRPAPPRPPVTPPPATPRVAAPQRPPNAIVIPPANENRFVANEVLVEFRAGTTAATITTIAQRNRLTRIDSQQFVLAGSTIERYRLPPGANVRAVLRTLGTTAQVFRAQPNYVYALVTDGSPVRKVPVSAGPIEGALVPETAPPPGGPSLQAAQPPQDATPASPSAQWQAMQYAIGKLQLAAAHRNARGENIRIAVIDSGVDTTHPEFNGMLAQSRDAIGGEITPHAHGTAMAGAIAARANLLGVAPGSDVIAVRAFNGAGGRSGAEGTTMHVLRALDMAHEAGARVVNMSFAGPQDAALSRAMASAAGHGMVLVAASGNAGARAAPMFPAADPNVIAVTATDAEDRVFADAVRGAHVAIAAPGVDVLVPAPQGRYDFTSGTSVAAAHVSGVVALMLERDPRLDVREVRRALREAAQDLGAAGPDPVFGAGLIDAGRAVDGIGNRLRGAELAPVRR